MKKLILLCMFLVSSTLQADEIKSTFSYFDNAGKDDVLAGGARLIPIDTPVGSFKVWTKRVGNNPRIKVLLLHGGPGLTHEYFEAFDGYFPGAAIEYYYYDQLGSAYSDQPNDPKLLDTARFVEEVEQVRQALHLDAQNFYLLGHSWGGILAMEYARKYQRHLKGLIISNMMSSMPEYIKYAEQVIMPKMDQTVLAKIKAMEAAKQFDDPRYMELLMPHYEAHILRMPSGQWPEPVNRSFAKLNKNVYVPMQGPSELGASGILADWDRTSDLAQLQIPTLVIGARYDTMDPQFMEMMSKRLPRGRYLYCPQGSHMSMYDDQQVYMKGVIDFILDVDRAGGAQAGAPKSVAPTEAQSAVVAKVQELFDAMEARNASALRAIFAPEAMLISTDERRTDPTPRVIPAATFVESIGAATAVLKERMHSPVVQIDGSIATLWAPYSLHRGDTLSHCGNNAFTLARREGRWWITAVSYTMRAPAECKLEN